MGGRAAGSRTARRRLASHLGGDDRRTGEVTLETVYCLGNCALSPAVTGRRRVARPGRRRAACGRSLRRDRAMSAAGASSSPAMPRPCRSVQPKRGRCDRRERVARGIELDARPQRQPWPVLAGAAGRDRRPRRAGWASARSRAADVPGLFDAGLADPARGMPPAIRCASAWSRDCLPEGRSSG